MDPHTWTCKGRATSTNIHSATMWEYGILSRRPAWGNERLGGVAREGQGYPCYQHDMMMMILLISAPLSNFYTTIYLISALIFTPLSVYFGIFDISVFYFLSYQDTCQTTVSYSDSSTLFLFSCLHDKTCHNLNGTMFSKIRLYSQVIYE